MDSATRTVRLCLLGYGSVARAFCTLLARQQQPLRRDHGLRVLVSGVGTRRGSLVAPVGLEPAEVLAAVADGKAPPQAPLAAGDLLAKSAADVLVELTVMEPDGAPLATGHVETAFALGMDVVTANKGPIAWNWRHVRDAAEAMERRIRFESTVMDGLPVFSLLERALPGCDLLGFDAVFNATTNFLIDAMGTGRSYEDALAQVQSDGYAEADPSNDVDGWDAASKSAALANVVMGAGITPADVERESLRDVPLERILRARTEGRRLRLVSSVRREPPAPGQAAPPGAGPSATTSRVRARLRAEELDIDHPLAAVGGESLGALLHTDLMADVLVSERHALVPQTAYGVYADLLHLCRTT